MKKKVLSVLLVAAMATCLLAGCGGASSDGGSNDVSGTESAGSSTNEETAASGDTITIWVADNTVDMTQEAAESWLADNGYSDWSVQVEAVSEADAASNMITDVEGGADIYSFAQDQLARLVAAGALQQIVGDYASWIEENNGAGSVDAGKVGDTVYAFPMTADNGYFLYYDGSALDDSDVETLEGLISKCEEIDRSLYYTLTAWYMESFFFGTGCTLEYTTTDSGEYDSATFDIASDAGVIALEKMIEMASSANTVCGDGAADLGSADAEKVVAIVDGTWDKTTAETLWGDDMKCAKLPTFTGSDGNTYQLGSFGGYKLIGIKPQTEETKLTICLGLAEYLTGYDMQMQRFTELGWGPSNTEAAESDEVQSDPTLAALAAQNEYGVPQGNYPDDYWTYLNAARDDIVGGEVSEDDDLMAYLTDLQDNLVALATAAE